MLMSTLLSFVLLPVIQDPQPAAPSPCLDRTGIQWLLPFEAAQAKAATAKRLLLIKPIAFGTTADGGW